VSVCPSTDFARRLRARHDRGLAYFTKGEYDRAISDYSEAVKFGPTNWIRYRNRGIAHFYGGSRGNAQADLDMAARLMPMDADTAYAYTALWREIISRQTNGPSILAQVVSQLNMAAWPGPIVSFVLGQGTQEAVLAFAKQSDPKQSRERVCEAQFFIGRFALGTGSKDEAKRAFQIAVRDCPRQSLEMGAATAELRALNSGTPATSQPAPKTRAIIYEQFDIQEANRLGLDRSEYTRRKALGERFCRALPGQGYLDCKQSVLQTGRMDTAAITLKLVSKRGGEARANTRFSVLTHGGDVVKEVSDASPLVILAEGEYRVVARNNDRTYERSFRVVTGVDVEVELLAR
jgi:tetratricopeptide (TPR) repeat protein